MGFYKKTGVFFSVRIQCMKTPTQIDENRVSSTDWSFENKPFHFKDLP